MIENLKREYELRYRIMRYSKLAKLYLYNRFEKNNVEIFKQVLEDLKTGSDLIKLKHLHEDS